MRKLFVFLGVAISAIGSAVSAQEVSSIAPLQKSSWGDAKQNEIVDYIPDVSLKARAGYGQNFTEGTGQFFGDGLYLNVDGYISPNFSYSLQQRLTSSYYEDNAGFNGTNWLTLTYEIGSFSLTAGKDALLVGSFEYDTDDLDSYYDMNSMFYNSFDCWQWGISAGWYPGERSSFIIQAANSPLWNGEENLFAYAAGWRFESDFYESYWTANMWEFERGRFVKALNLGNRFHVGNFSCDLEYMTRAVDFKNFFVNDYTALISPSYQFGELCRIFAKCGYERVREENLFEDFDTNLFYGAGVEFFPLKEDKDIRIHAAWSSNSFFGDTLNLGLTWNLDFTTAAKHLFHNSDR